MKPEIPVREALLQGVKLLGDARVPEPRLTAEVLLCHALHRERSYLYGHPEQLLSELEWIHYGRYLDERMRGKPTQYITKVQEFYGRPFRVSPAVLIPRPETEHVIEAAMKVAPAARQVLDIGTGSGAIAVTLALEMRYAAVTGTDISPAALAVARQNAEANRASVPFAACDLGSAIAARCMDLVVSNPPYVPLEDKSTIQVEVRDHEPEVALYGGPKGTETYQRLIPDAARILKPGGWLVMELGYRSLDAVRAMLGAPWGAIEVTADLAGWPRVIAAQYRSGTAPRDPIDVPGNLTRP